MRKVAGLSFTSTKATPEIATSLFDKCITAVESWLSSKGVIDDDAAADNFHLIDGRVATVTRTLDAVDGGGTLLRVRLQEPSDGVIFETYLSLGVRDTVAGAFFELRVGAPRLGASVRFDAHVPRVVRDVIGLTDDWSMLDTPVIARAVSFEGTTAGDQLKKILWHPDRVLPVVMVSDYEGVLLAPGIHDTLARDLAGVALVVRADRDCCWQLSALRGTEWSCYNGAIRLYYPRIAESPELGRHPLWTLRSMYYYGEDTEQAVRRIRQSLRRSCLSFSAFATYVAPPIGALESQAATKQFRIAKAAAAADKDWDELERLYAQENDRLRQQMVQRDAEIEDLRTQLANLQMALQWKAEEEHDTAPPAAAAPPATVMDAVQRAEKDYSNELLFGDDVDSNAERLVADAGPPDKILLYLEALSQLARARQSGPIGKTMLQWLQGKGISASGESETIRKSESEMAKRAFRVNGAKRQFELHLKPSDHVSQNRCVRIYFDYDDTLKRVVIGTVGPHP